MVRFLLLSTFLSCSFAASAMAEESLTQRLERMEQEIQSLKQQVAAAEAKAARAEMVAAPKAEKAAGTSVPAKVEYGKKGLLVASADERAWFSIRGYAQFDGRFYLDDEDDSARDEFRARRLRPTFSGGIDDFSFRIMPDFAGGELRLLDAHADYKFADAFQLRFGKFKTPVSLERLQSASEIAFMERGLVTNLAPTRDFGFMAYGNLWDDTVEYQLGVFNGNPDLGSGDNDEDDNKDVAGRIFTYPFKKTDMAALQGLGIGIAGSVGERGGSAGDPILTDYVSLGQQRFFTHSAGTFADGTHWRLYPQANYYYGSFGAMAEYAVSGQEVTNGAVSDDLRHEAWQTYVSYVLTGEDAGFTGVKPRENFDWQNGRWGAFEVAARVGQLSLDEDAFPVFASASASQEEDSYGLGLNWYLNERVKWQLNYDFTEFSGGAARPDENALFTRVQYQF